MIQDDADYFLERFKLRPIGSLGLENETAHGRFGKLRQFNTSMEYFSNITLSQAKELYKIYEEDFLLFDYKPDDYFRYAKQ